MPCLHHFGRFDSNRLICDDEIGAGEFLVVALCSLVLGQSNHATFSHRLQHAYDEQIIGTLGLRHSNHGAIPPNDGYELIPQK